MRAADPGITSSPTWLTLIGVSCRNTVTPLSLSTEKLILHYRHVDLPSSSEAFSVYPSYVEHVANINLDILSINV